VITFTGGAPGGLQVIKRFTVRDNDPVVNLDVEVRGVPVSATNPALEIGWLGGLPRAERNLKLEQTSMTAVASVGQSLEKLQPSRQKTPSEKRFPGAVHWVGTHNKYFFVGILPPADLATEAVLSGQPGEEPTAGAALRVPVAGTSASYAFRLYLGPLSYPNLKPLGMDRAVDLGWKWILPLSRALLSLMTFMYVGAELRLGHPAVDPHQGGLLPDDGQRPAPCARCSDPAGNGAFRKKYADDPQKPSRP
jgi:YidC/Oxa1 family membrane protein insertase